MRPSIIESIGPLLIVEAIALGVVADIAEMRPFDEIVLVFWGVVSLLFVPWWFLGVRMGQRVKPSSRLIG